LSRAAGRRSHGHPDSAIPEFYWRRSRRDLHVPAVDPGREESRSRSAAAGRAGQRRSL